MSDDTLEPQDDAEVEGHKRLRNDMPTDDDEPEVEGHRLPRG
jgi:hypothetical protein